MWKGLDDGPSGLYNEGMTQSRSHPNGPLFAVTAPPVQVSDLPEDRQAKLGQYFTPVHVAHFMARLFSRSAQRVRLLDPGAGAGALSQATVRWFGENQVTSITAVEIDPAVAAQFAENLTGTPHELHQADFIEWALESIGAGKRFTHAILNPPYKKISGRSRHKRQLSAAGVPSTNLYSAFIALSIRLVEPGGEIVAIVPRSFCNGLYYRPFRKDLLSLCSLDHLHLFSSRTATFKHDGVLQENVILKLTVGAKQGSVTVSHSTDDSFDDYRAQELPFESVVPDPEGERFIHVPDSDKGSQLESLAGARYTLKQLGLKVSTGPVVDFRLRSHLSAMPADGTVPLIYPGHFTRSEVCWPKPDYKKANAIFRNAETERWLYDAGTYCVVRRFSSKEESRRIVAGVIDAKALGADEKIGFENHINVFHAGKQGISKRVAIGLVVYLGSAVVDKHFRQFNGHTQVNVTDLKQLPYPSTDKLEQLAGLAETHADDPKRLETEVIRTLS
ncbi:MAG: N-6 DNA methylase [Bacteroidota bacterium]